MPLVRIDTTRPLAPERRGALGEAVHRAMVETLNVPPDDRFQAQDPSHLSSGDRA